MVAQVDNMSTYRKFVCEKDSDEIWEENRMVSCFVGKKMTDKRLSWTNLQRRSGLLAFIGEAPEHLRRSCHCFEEVFQQGHSFIQNSNEIYRSTNPRTSQVCRPAFMRRETGKGNRTVSRVGFQIASGVCIQYRSQ